MDPLLHAPDAAHAAHLEEARRVLALPLEVNRLKWHPFGVYAVPLAKREVDGVVLSRRLHVWHPEARPLGAASPYGVHTHTGTGRSHVLAGSLQHHLYEFAPDDEGAWKQCSKDGERQARLLGHLQAPTLAGMTHTLPAHQPHGVATRGEFAISLFEQSEASRALPFTTWQRTDVEAEEVDLVGPVAARRVVQEALAVVEEALFATQ